MDILRSVQMVELDLLREVDRICRKNDIKYSLASGTLLGAVRHKGFIPWDDDVDVAMDYPNYIKFCEVCVVELDSKKYFLQNLSTDPHYLYIFAKLRRHNTLYIRKGQEHMKYHHGVCIDIWPMHPVPNPANRVLTFLHKMIVTRCKTIMWSPIGAVSEKKMYLRMFYKLLSLIPKNIPAKIVNALAKKCKGGYYWCIASPLFATETLSAKQCVDLQIRGYVEVEFEGYKFMAVDNYEESLKYLYGDYMRLPPEDERQGHHNATTVNIGNVLSELIKEETIYD